MNAIVQFFRKPLAKIITRAVLYGLAPLIAWLGIETALDAESVQGAAEGIGEALAGLTCLIVGAVIDLRHHRKDRGQMPAARGPANGGATA